MAIGTLQLGDGILSDQGTPQEQELGSPIYQLKTIRHYGPDILICFGREAEKCPTTGSRVSKTNDADADRKNETLSWVCETQDSSRER